MGLNSPLQGYLYPLIFGQNSITFRLKYRSWYFSPYWPLLVISSTVETNIGSWCNVATHRRQGRRTCRCAQRSPTADWTPSGHGCRKVNLLFLCRRSSAGLSTRRNRSAPAFPDLQHDSTPLTQQYDTSEPLSLQQSYCWTIESTTNSSLNHRAYNYFTTEPLCLRQSAYCTVESTTNSSLDHRVYDRATTEPSSLQ
jgi:hypothetical protein